MSTTLEKNRYQTIRTQRAPLGAVCPHCHAADQVYYSSAQLRRPLYKRTLFAYLRCHSCTHRFRHVKVSTFVFTGAALVIFMFAGVLG